MPTTGEPPASPDLAGIITDPRSDAQEPGHGTTSRGDAVWPYPNPDL
jgi:hypothetical protein